MIVTDAGDAFYAARKPPWEGWPACPCGCGAEGVKLSEKEPHHLVRVCACSSCRNRRNQKRGRKAQYKTHKALGGQGYSPYHEESGLFADLTVRPEVKAGAQVPASFRSFVAGKWFKDALRQSEKAIPVGIDAKPSVCIDGRWLVVDIKAKR